MEYTFDKVRLTPEKQIDLHSQPSFELSYILKGSGLRTIGTLSAPFGSGELILIPPHIPHKWEFDPSCVDSGGNISNLTLCFMPSMLEGLSRIFPGMSRTLLSLENMEGAVLFQGSVRDRIASLLEKVEESGGAERASLILRILEAASLQTEALEVGGQTLPPGSDERRMEKVRIYVSCNYSRRILLEDVASHIGMNRSAFCRFFKARAGETFISYLTAYRISRACELLSEGELQVGEAATASGFESLPHFCRTFRKLKGMSPSQYLLQTRKA